MITFLAAILVLASVGVVSWPLLRGLGNRNGTGLVEDTEVSELLVQKDATLFDISELESDYNMGNLSLGDYQELRQRYEEKAIALLKKVDELQGERLDEASHIDDEIEVRVSKLRSASNTTEPEVETPAIELRARHVPQAATGKLCPACGAQLEADDQFCFKCGAATNKKCPNCSAAVDTEDLFCARCGTALSKEANPGKVS